MKKNISLIFLLIFFSNCEAIFVEDISDKAVVLLAPTENATVSSGTVQFNWQSVPDATNYELQIATPTFLNANQIVLDTLITKTSFSKTLEVGDYEWRVKAINSDYSTNHTTTSFTVN